MNFFSILKKDVPKKQLVYYQVGISHFSSGFIQRTNNYLTFKTGIGTYTIPQIAQPMMAKLHQIMDTMVGKSLNVHVMGGSNI